MDIKARKSKLLRRVRNCLELNWKTTEMRELTHENII